MVSKSLIILAGIIVVLILAGFLIISGSGGVSKETTANTQAKTSAPVSTTTSAPTTTVAPAVTQMPTETPTVEEYVDVSKGGTYGPNSDVYIPEFDVKGTIGTGKIVDGKVVSTSMALIDDNGEIIWDYAQTDHSTYGHLELISKPQEGEVVMKQGGNVLDVCLKYDGAYSFTDYVGVVFKSEKWSPAIKEDLYC